MLNKPLSNDEKSLANTHAQSVSNMRFLLVIVCLVLLLFGIGSNIALANASETPETLVRDSTSQILSRLRAGDQPTRDQVFAMVDEIILPHFDFVRMSRWVLGKHWRHASTDQKKRFPAEFRALLVRTYATALTEYTSQTIRYLPQRVNQADGDATVRTEIVQAGGPVIPVNYRLYRNDGAWMVYDVIIDGVSLLTTYRKSFSAQIRRSGLDHLIHQLSERNQTVARAD